MLENAEGRVSRNFSNFKFLKIILGFISQYDLLVVELILNPLSKIREDVYCFYCHFFI